MISLIFSEKILDLLARRKRNPAATAARRILVGFTGHR